MNEKQQTDSDWQECPQGMLTGISSVHHRAELGRKLKSVAAVCLVALCCFGVYKTLPVSPEPVRQLSCLEVLQHMNGYFADSLSVEDKGLVDEHLANCVMCRKKYGRKAESLGIDFVVGVGGPPFASPMLVPAFYLSGFQANTTPVSTSLRLLPRYVRKDVPLPL